MFAAMGLTALSVKEWDLTRCRGLSNEGLERSQFIDLMRDALGTCLSFCVQCEAMNEVYLMLLILDACFLEHSKGDASEFTSISKASSE